MGDKPPPYNPSFKGENPPPYSEHPQPPSNIVPIYQQYSYAPAFQTQNEQNYGAIHQIVTPQIVLVGTCPACQVGVLEDDYTCLGLLCAILFFPIGILCCLALKNRRCSNCGAYFG